jgi:hypothetical protein
MLRLLHRHFAIIGAIATALSIAALGQNVPPPGAKLANIVGTVTDPNGDPVPNANIVLQGRGPDDRVTLVTAENGYFEFHSLEPGIPYKLSVSAKDFADWTSPAILLEPGEFRIVTSIELQIQGERTTVDVHYDPVEVATEQLKMEEQQRIFGFIPNFYTSYEKDPAPLTAEMKFELALKVSGDPVTTAGIFAFAGIRQAADSPRYGQGWDAFGKRVGSTAADGFTDIMIGGAILPSLLHQDPRYFYQGSGTTSSRFRHAMFSPFVTRSDSGKSMPNYSSLGGILASSAISNLYFPRADRGAGLVFGNFAIGIAERIGAALAQEFIISKFTRRGGHVK